MKYLPGVSHDIYHASELQHWKQSEVASQMSS